MILSPHLVNFSQHVKILTKLQKKWKPLVTAEAHNFHSSSCNCSRYHSESVILRELIIIFTKCLFLDTLKIQYSYREWELTVAVLSYKCVFLVIRRKILEVQLLVRLASKIWPCLFIFFKSLSISRYCLTGTENPTFWKASDSPPNMVALINWKQGGKNGFRLSRKRVAALQEITHLRRCMSWIKISLFRDIIKSPTEIPLQNPWKIHDVTTASHLLAISFHCTLDNGHLTHTAIPDDITLSSW